MQFITSTVAAIWSGSGVQLGAGTGSWSSPSLVEIYAIQRDLDFINIQVYPVQLDNRIPLSNILAMVDVARSSGKGLVVGESWLYKATTGEMATSQVTLGEC